MTFGCEVETLRDNGYGKLRHNKKLGETVVKCINNSQHTLRLVPEPRERRSASPGEDLTFVCTSSGADPPPKLTLTAGGRDVKEIYGGSVAPAIVQGRENDHAIQGTLLQLSRELFEDNYLPLECLAHYGNYLMGKEELNLAKAEETRQEARTNYGSGSYRYIYTLLSTPLTSFSAALRLNLTFLMTPSAAIPVAMAGNVAQL